MIVWPSIERSENSTGAEGFLASTSEDANSNAEKNANSDLRFISNIYAPSPVFKWPGNPLDEQRNLLVGHSDSSLNIKQTVVFHLTRLVIRSLSEVFELAEERQRSPHVERRNHPMCPCRTQSNSNGPAGV